MEELEPPPPWCRDDRDDDIFFDRAVCSVSVSEPDSATDLEDLASRFFVPVTVPLPLSLLFCEEDEDLRLWPPCRREELLLLAFGVAALGSSSWSSGS